MKVKASWVTFVPIMVGAVLLHIYYIIFLGGESINQPLFGEYELVINQGTEPELIVLLAAVLFIFCSFFSLIDRKTSPYCEIKSAPLSGLFLAAAGLLLSVDSFVKVQTSGEWAVVHFFGLAAAVVFALSGMGLLVGYNVCNKMRILMIVPTVWSSLCMVTTFISHRRDAPSYAFFDVFTYVFMTLYIFENSMVLSSIEIKNPVKSSFKYGFLFILFACVYCISDISKSVNELGGFNATLYFGYFVVAFLAAYALFFNMKLSSCMITKKKAAELRDEPEEDEEEEEEKTEDDAPEAAFGVGSTKYVTAEFDKIRLEKAAKKAKERTGNIPNIDNAFSEDFENDEEDEPMSTLDKIDQLIMELSEDGSSSKKDD